MNETNTLPAVVTRYPCALGPLPVPAPDKAYQDRRVQVLPEGPGDSWWAAPFLKVGLSNWLPQNPPASSLPADGSDASCGTAPGEVAVLAEAPGFCLATPAGLPSAVAAEAGCSGNAGGHAPSANSLLQYLRRMNASKSELS
ncbi:MAG: hypothetical protein FRX49_06918 [Trebouxia sp. A1-2]|nr:MAG: hypothetical protein FRX49_06918 [Trebouxia sp. A1-2]